MTGFQFGFLTNGFLDYVYREFIPPVSVFFCDGKVKIFRNLNYYQMVNSDHLLNGGLILSIQRTVGIQNHFVCL